MSPEHHQILSTPPGCQGQHTIAQKLSYEKYLVLEFIHDPVKKFVGNYEKS